MKTANTSGFSLLVAMGLSLVMSIIALVILEYVVPFSRRVSGIEHTTNSYYQAHTAIEDSLYFVKKEPLGSQTGKLLASNAISPTDYGYSVVASGTTLPKPGTGNSEFDSDWNKIRVGDPIQLEVGEDFMSPSVFRVYFRVPDLQSGSPLTLSGGSTTSIINWQISSDNNTLNADNSYIMADNICTSNPSSCGGILLGSRQGRETFNNATPIFASFYAGNCSSSNKCSLKLSVIGELELSTNNTPIPYLEWQIQTGNSTAIPLRYTQIEAKGKSHGFEKTLQTNIPQQTVIEAFDFTVFQ